MPEVTNLNDPRTSMEHWLPKVTGVEGIDIPQTELISVEIDLSADEVVQYSSDAVADAVDSLPTDQIFVRTERRSMKDAWPETCVARGTPEAVENTITRLALAIAPRQIEAIALREFLDLDTRFTYRNRPIAPEVRVFIDDGEVLCLHPYWPEDSLSDIGSDDPTWRDKIEEINERIHADADTIRGLAQRLADGPFDEGGWSVDFALTNDRGWVLIDMALYGLYPRKKGEDDIEWCSISWHPDSCQHNLEQHPPDTLPVIDP